MYGAIDHVYTLCTSPSLNPKSQTPNTNALTLMRRGERAGVFACGPASLMADVSEAQGKMTANTHLHKETFEW